MSGKPRILAIRGGAIGDFIVTLPALGLLRENFAHCHLEILGYPHIAELALRGGPRRGTTYVDAVRSIEYGPLASFFAARSNLPADLVDYFSSFQQVVSWLFDPDGIFEANLRRAGVKNYLHAYSRLNETEHAALQLARPLERLALFYEEKPFCLVPCEMDQAAADLWLNERGLHAAEPWYALHPGSGSARKNWPAENWLEVARMIRKQGRRILLIGGEADQTPLEWLKREMPDSIVANSLPLPTLGAVLNRCAHYFGHDTGVSHLAATVGASCTVLFSSSNPVVWSPLGAQVCVLTRPDPEFSKPPDTTLLDTISARLHDARCHRSLDV